MTKKEILNYLELINSELTDVSSYRYWLCINRQELVEELTRNIENNRTISDKEKNMTSTF